MRRPPQRRVETRKVRFRPLLEVAEARILLSITSRGAAAIVNKLDGRALRTSPAVEAMDANGDSIVVWKDASKENPTDLYESDIRAQRYSPTGAKVQQKRNDRRRGRSSSFTRSGRTRNSSSETTPQVADGSEARRLRRRLAAERHHDDGQLPLEEIQARVFNSAGARPPDRRYQHHGQQSHRPQQPRRDDGRLGQLGDYLDRSARRQQCGERRRLRRERFSLSRTKQTLNGSTSPLLVNAGGTTGNQFSSSVGTDASGNFDVTWTSLAAGSGLDTEVFARQFNSTATVQGSLIHVNTTTTNGQGSSQIAVTPAGDFIVAWVNDLDDGTSGRGDIFARRHTIPTAAARTGEFQVNSNPLRIPGRPRRRPLTRTATPRSSGGTSPIPTARTRASSPAG